MPSRRRKYGGSGFLQSTITRHQLARMGEVPMVLGAMVTVQPQAVRKYK
jgi:hypothetical protein